MTLYVITDWQTTPANGAITVDVVTDVPVDLYLAVVPTEPTHVPRYIVSRGLMTPCGFDIHWPPPQYIHQQPPGPSLTHHFPFYCGTPGLEWWGTVTDMPQLEKPAASYPPMPLGACPLPPLHAELHLADPPFRSYGPGGFPKLIWTQDRGSTNWPIPPFPATDIPLPWPGSYSYSLDGSATLGSGFGLVQTCIIPPSHTVGGCGTRFYVAGLGTLFLEFGSFSCQDGGVLYGQTAPPGFTTWITLTTFGRGTNLDIYYDRC